MSLSVPACFPIQSLYSNHPQQWQISQRTTAPLPQVTLRLEAHTMIQVTPPPEPQIPSLIQTPD